MTEDFHWGPDPGHGGLTQHKGSRRDCAGPDCGSDEGSHFHQATQRLDASDWQWQEAKPKGALREALVAQVHSNLAIAVELRRSNDQRDAFNEAMLEFFERLTEGRSAPGATAQGEGKGG
ncbi:hypothetical protein C8D88_116101 [Lentzea atacamensis]|uniref:Uncharacterized protein n=1 Tax=Lentzea atacamensis TaxID=531938 RepID=A0A316HND7_9PSEU|nr:hypothetical protein [Lentzea atacamensis]PWK81690.1 hypothetical protein C8D88_116101 [Lentzea atacamensis]